MHELFTKLNKLQVEKLPANHTETAILLLQIQQQVQDTPIDDEAWLAVSQDVRQLMTLSATAMIASAMASKTS